MMPASANTVDDADLTTPVIDLNLRLAQQQQRQQQQQRVLDRWTYLRQHRLQQKSLFRAEFLTWYKVREADDRCVTFPTIPGLQMTIITSISLARGVGGSGECRISTSSFPCQECFDASIILTREKLRQVPRSVSIDVDELLLDGIFDRVGYIGAVSSV